MFTINGKYTNALVTTENVEEEAIAQITELVNSAAAMGSKIVIMPDVHAGKGCVIGTTMTITDRVVPNLVGVDIGCGVLAFEVPIDIDFEKLQAVIDRGVPSGMNVHNKQKNFTMDEKLATLNTPLSDKQLSHIQNSIGTLGGGNHFISIETDGEKAYLIIHSGSRNLGTQVAKYHQDIAVKSLKVNDRDAIVAKLKAEGRHKEIAEVLANLPKQEVNKDLAFLQGEAMENYLHDVYIAQEYAKTNRREMIKTIFDGMGWNSWGRERIESVHNYIDIDEGILRKGAIAAKGKFLVPLNMKDGTLICQGAENETWNNSAPHGAGRTMSRSKAKATLNVEDFKEEMKNVWSATVGQSTLDEAPAAYKPAEEIKALIGEQYVVLRHLKTVFNFKASE
jgi:tRNA-splicing ligase RtcB